MKWLVFSYSLPAKSGSAPRVALWRRLRRLGAISPAGGVQVLPDNAECAEAFQWLAQEMRHAGGEALVMHVEGFSGLGDGQLIELFRAARAEDYAELEGRLAELEGATRGPEPPAEAPALQETLERLRRRHADISRVDYFRSPEGARVAARLAQAGRAFGGSHESEEQVARVDWAAYRGRRWVTRPRPHVDRLACAWLIRRFVDPAAAIRYAGEPEPDEVGFDMEGAKFGHRGALCTFETMLRAFGLDEPALEAMAQIVHEIDLRDGLYARPETAGLDAVLAGWLSASTADAELEAHGIALYEGLYASLSRTSAASRQE
jgi:hypothetical protein